MTEKELHKLRRHDLLQLLLAQGREAAQLQAQIDEMTGELNNLQEANNRFIGRMNDKDAQIEKLKGRLDEKDIQVEKFKGRLKEKDVQIDKLKSRLDQKDIQIGELRKVIEEYRSGRIFEMDGKISIADVAQKLEGIFMAAQRAVDHYLENISRTEKGGAPAAERECGTGDSPGMADSGKPGTEDEYGMDDIPQPGFGRSTARMPAEMNDTGEQHEKETDRNGSPDA